MQAASWVPPNAEVAGPWPPGSWAALLVAGLGGAVAFWWWRRNRSDAGTGRVPLLAQADCLFWDATLTRHPTGWSWRSTVQPSALADVLLAGGRRTFDRSPWNDPRVSGYAEIERRLHAAITAGETRYEHRFRLVAGEGRTRWLEEKVALARKTEREIHVVGLVTDVTARHESEQAWRASEERLGQLLARADCLLWEAEVVTSGEQWAWTFKIQRSGLSLRLIGEDLSLHEQGLWYQFQIPEQREMDQRCREALRTGAPDYEQEFHIIRPGGQTVWLRESVSIKSLGEGRFSLVGVVTDITEQREAVRARIASEEQLRQLLDHSDCMLWQAHVTRDAAGKFQWHWFVPNSDLYRRIVRDEPPLEPRMPWSHAIVPEFAEIETRSRQAMEQDLPGYEQEFRVVLGSVMLWLHEQVTITRRGENEWTLDGVVIDVSEQRLAQEARSVSEAQLRQVVETADFLLWHARVFQSPEGDLRWALTVPPSNLYRRLFGREPEPRWPVMPWDKLVDAKQRAEMVDLAGDAILRGDTGYEQEISANKDGGVVWLHEQATIRRIGAGEWQLVGVVTDVTAHREAEAGRRASDETLAQILERADCLLWRVRVSRDGDSIRWGHFDMPRSRLSVELFGERQSLVADQLWNLIEVPDLPEMSARARAALFHGEAGYEQAFRATREGRTFWLDERVSIRAESPGEWQLVGLITDVTARHLAEEARRRVEARLEQLLERADCTIWQGQVTLTAPDRFTWTIYVPRSRLFRRIFGNDPRDRDVFDWKAIGVPELDEMIERSRKALRDGAPGYAQIFHVPKPVRDIWLSEQVSITPAGPHRWDLVGVITDITDRHEADEARRASEDQLQQILERADCMVWQAVTTERPGGGHDWNLYTLRSVLYQRLFGDVDEPRLDWTQLDVPEMAEMEVRAREALDSGASGYEQVFRAVLPLKVIWLREVVTIAPAGKGRHRLVGVITDITEQREAQEAQRASEAQVDQILTTADCLLWQARVFKVSEDTLRWVMFIPRSRLYREVFGTDPASPPTLLWPEVVDADTNAMIDRRACEAIFGGQPGYEQEFRAQRGDRVFWLHEAVSINAAGPDEWRLVGVITDLSGRRAAAQAVEASERRFRTLFQHTPVAVVEADFTAVGAWLDDLRRSGLEDLGAWLDADPVRLVEAAKRVRVLDCNDTAMTMLRARAKSDFRRRRTLLATGDAMRAIRDALVTLWAGRNTMETQIEMRDFERRVHYMNVRWWTGLGAAGLELAQTVMVFVDLTELKQAEAALAAEKERLAVTLRAMTEGVVTTDVDGRVQFMNPAAAHLTRWQVDEAIGRTVAEICRLESERDGTVVAVPIRRVAQGDVVIDLPPQTRLAARDGSWRLVEGCCAPIHSTESRVIGAVLVFRDVTEHERLEQELVRATRLESVGILAGGIAHDFNNILTAVMGNLALALLDVEPASEVGLSLRAAEKASLRARDLTQQLLTFAKGGEPVRTSVRLEAIVREMTSFSLHGSRVKPQFDLPEDLWPASVDKGQIGRVVQNLTINAAQAMPEGGTLAISARNDMVAALARPPLAAGPYIRIEITDSGVGIRPEHVARIFDPYFTTKQTGSGLGLAAVYSIVVKHHGHIAVESELGRGTTFRIWLPASPASIPAGEATPPSAATPLRGRVLFMDDEEIIRTMATMLLRRCGLEVTCAVDGAEAVEKYRAARERGEPFALVIMDLTIPGGIGGKEAIALLRAIDPEVKAIVSSGYSSDPVLANYRAHGFAGVVAKPYEYNEFVQVLREVLAG